MKKSFRMYMITNSGMGLPKYYTMFHKLYTLNFTKEENMKKYVLIKVMYNRNKRHNNLS